MEKPVLYYQESSDHPDQVACMMSLVPSFIEKYVDTDELYQTEEEKPDPQDVQTLRDGNCMFIFIVDRSGSMSGSNIHTTKEALKLFLKSLPMGSMFEIVSFGDAFVQMSTDKKGFKYDDNSLDAALS